MRSGLPPLEQLALHVEVDEFMRHLQQDESFRSKCRNLAAAVHAYYSAGIKEKREEIYVNKSYETLPEHIKADNMAAALRIPEVLSLIGLGLARKASPDDVTGADVRKTLKKRQNLEILAAAEHDGWMRYRSLNGWAYDQLDKIESLGPEQEALKRDLDIERDKRRHSNLKRRLKRVTERLEKESRHASRCKWRNTLIPYAELPQRQKQKDKSSVLAYPDIVDLAGFKIVFEEMPDLT